MLGITVMEELKFMTLQKTLRMFLNIKNNMHGLKLFSLASLIKLKTTVMKQISKVYATKNTPYWT